MFPSLDTSSLASLLAREDIVSTCQELAREAYPKEFAALVLANGVVVPLDNQSNEGAEEFRIDPKVWIRFESETVALIHSHPDGDLWPSAADIQTQSETSVAMGLMVTTANAVTQPFWWGDDLPRGDLLGRPFRHGPSGTDGKGDCYAVIRDFYATERGVILPEFPRDWLWWEQAEDRPAQSLYVNGFAKAGFRQISFNEIRPGDVFLAEIKANTPNHGGIYWGNNQILHHLVDRISGRTVMGPWLRFVTHWLRYEDDIPAWEPPRAVR